MEASADDEAAIREAAVGLLARREHSRRELLRKLADRGFERDTCERVVATLDAEGLQSDERFAESYVRTRIDRGFGPQRIEAELRERGVDAETIGLQLETLDRREWAELGRAAREKRFGPEAPVDQRERARQMRFLQYRGFGGDHIRRILDDD